MFGIFHINFQSKEKGIWSLAIDFFPFFLRLSCNAVKKVEYNLKDHDEYCEGLELPSTLLVFDNTSSSTDHV